MSLKRIMTGAFRSAYILYAVKTIASVVMVAPFMVYLNHKYDLTILAEGFWPVPSNLLLMELLWSIREVIYIAIPLLMMVCALYFLAVQFLLGGICGYALNISSHSNGKFFIYCAERFWGFVKIALAAIFIYFFMLLIADFAGHFIDGLIAGIAGGTLGKLIRAALLFLAFFLSSGYLVCLRLIQTTNNSSSLISTLAASSKIVLKNFRSFIKLNVLVAAMIIVSVLIPLLVLSYIYKMGPGFVSVILAILTQQAVVFIWSYFESLQININAKLFKE